MELLQNLVTGAFICLWLFGLCHVLIGGGLTRIGKVTLLSVSTAIAVGGRMAAISLFSGDTSSGLWGAGILIAGVALIFLAPQSLTARSER
ncbi:hypothetical protein PAQ31011_05144 [Pandoraea aquatica]|uniref:Uncharacterized protein n=1 Tax=Pandoraea aquatica TaxID=2508290 RepID=A0A5E4Z905_9BURK|nr:hypothetical protein [Pandoraea aquatica]VVE56800.1 hypothetical protein PAQ31011_05144 [Pandoraea aquatica]